LIFVRRLVEAGDFANELERGAADFVRRDGRIEIVTPSADLVVSRARTRLAHRRIKSAGIGGSATSASFRAQ
jgi:hypothetical protein